MDDRTQSHQNDEVLRDRLRQMILGYQVSRCVHLAAKLGIADLLEDGPKSACELATRTRTQPTALERFLRVLSSHGVLAVDDLGRFSLTPIAALLSSRATHSLWAAAVYWGEPWIWQPWEHMLHSLQTGTPAFDVLHGTSFFNFLARTPEAGRIFDRFIAEGLHERPHTVVSAYDFSQSNVIVDVGGGQGAMLAAILAANPAARGILFDRQNVIEGAHARLVGAGVSNRCSIVSGNFFEMIPGGADTYLLSQIIHDWTDEPAITILRNCRRAMGTGGKLFLIERLMDRLRPEPTTALLDLTMLAVLGGQERTLEEYCVLFLHANFRLSRIIPTGSPFSIIEAMPT
jgi:ubiquinone/menaquinone biosynthesis C-methylase UbiE